MDYNIKFQPSTQLYYARIPDGSRYGRKITAKTKQALMDKLKNLWVMPHFFRKVLSPLFCLISFLF